LFTFVSSSGKTLPIMPQSNYPLRLQASLLEEVWRLAEQEGASINQFINVAVAEKLSALRLESYQRERAQRADVPVALALLDRLGSELPRAGDEVEVGSAATDSRLRPARRSRANRRRGASDR
jgi:hypothetical protein